MKMVSAEEIKHEISDLSELYPKEIDDFVDSVMKAIDGTQNIDVTVCRYCANCDPDIFNDGYDKRYGLCMLSKTSVNPDKDYCCLYQDKTYK